MTCFIMYDDNFLNYCFALLKYNFKESLAFVKGFVFTESCHPFHPFNRLTAVNQTFFHDYFVSETRS